MKPQLKYLVLSTILGVTALSLPAQAAAESSTFLAQEPIRLSALPLEPEAVTRQELMHFSQPAAQQTTLFGLPLNMGPVDRILRGVIAAGLVGTGIYGLSTNAFGTNTAAISWSMIGVAAIPTFTASTGYCPLYQLFGLEYSF